MLQQDINGTHSNPMYQSTSTEQALPIKGKLGMDVSMGMSNPVYEGIKLLMFMLYVCLYVCVYVCMFVCMYVYVCTYLCRYVCM